MIGVPDGFISWGWLGIAVGAADGLLHIVAAAPHAVGRGVNQLQAAEMVDVGARLTA